MLRPVKEREILKVASSPEASHLAGAEHLPLETTNQ
jgi:hypothetical protein